MGLSFLPSISAPRVDSASTGLDLRTLSYLGAVFTTVDPQDFDGALEFLKKVTTEYVVGFAVHLDVTGLNSIEDIISLLDAGAAKVFVNYDQLKQLEKIENINLDRLVLKLSSKDHKTKEQIIEAIGDTTVGVYNEDVSDVGLLEDWLREYGDSRPPVYVSLTNTDPEAVKKNISDLTKLSAIPIVPAKALAVDEGADPGLIPVRTILRVESDRPDGLLSTVVTDERGIALGFVFSTLESIQESLRTGRGVYYSRKRGLWYKGDSSGDIQKLIRIETDCDNDCVKFVVLQVGKGFCHLATATCFGQYNGLSRLQKTLRARQQSAPEGSYTARLFSSPQLLRAKIMEEAEELCQAETAEEIAFEAADLFYFVLTKCVSAGVTLADVERNLDAKNLKTTRRKGDAKGQWAEKEGLTNNGMKNTDLSTMIPDKQNTGNKTQENKPPEETTAPPTDYIRMKRYSTSIASTDEIQQALQRPSQKSTESIMGIVGPIISAVRERGDSALLEYTHKFEKATSLTSPVLRAPFPASLRQLSQETVEAIDTSFANIHKFHLAQKEQAPLEVETMPGVVCSRFSRPIERVGLYIPGGTAVLPSTALMLGVPALVAGCKQIVLASPPRSDGSITPEIVYIAEKIGAHSIVLAGGAQAVAAMAYGTESVPKVDKILGPGNQFVTAAKMLVSNDTNAGVSIDMPAGPSEVLVIADAHANPAFVASDLLSQAEHGVDSQVVLIAVGMNESQLKAIETELHEQALALPRVDIIRGAIQHSVTLEVEDIKEAMKFSNLYAPEHLILQVEKAEDVMYLVENAGSVFIGAWTPESVGDYSAGVNHSLPTYGYAKQYSGVNLSSYVKHITSSRLTKEGLRNVSHATMRLAEVEGLEAHRRAVEMRLKVMEL
ncbi:MAG: imidazoleglycerol-phosphate dehydratase [Watsoniomyces obsoletus]|nr:MAG: imidazoleglycerol-phosphate dehydratase [Watsoniomyces obsoletus]